MKAKVRGRVPEVEGGLFLRKDSTFSHEEELFGSQEERGSHRKSIDLISYGTQSLRLPLESLWKEFQPLHMRGGGRRS
jgi:hypothetical protein